MSKSTSALLREAYASIYAGHETSDSPDKSRLTMARRIADYALTYADEGPVILDIGAGMQSVERILRMLGNATSGKGKYAGLIDALQGSRFLTMDIAASPQRRQRINWASHFVGDVAMLPIRESSVDLVVSNLAIDMLRRDRDQFGSVMQVVGGILRPQGLAFLNFHHASLYPTNCDFYRDKDMPQAEFFDRSLPNPYYEDDETILRDLSTAGLIGAVSLQADMADVWWEVEAIKSS